MRSGVCYSYKEEILKGLHKIDDQYYIALYTDKAKLSPKTKTYIKTNELESDVTFDYGYETGGRPLENIKVFSNKGSAFLTFDNPVWTDVTFTAKGALIYNNSLQDKNAVAVVNFDKEYTAINGEFIIELSKYNNKTTFIKIT